MLQDPFLAGLVQDAMLYFDHFRYAMHAWVIMPNHVHALFTPFEGYSLHSITHSWKSFTSNQANRHLDRTGHFWFPESFDRYIRNDTHYANAMAYIENNPVKAGLCAKAEDWLCRSAHYR